MIKIGTLCIIVLAPMAPRLLGKVCEVIDEPSKFGHPYVVAVPGEGPHWSCHGGCLFPISDPDASGDDSTSRDSHLPARHEPVAA